MRLLLNLSEYLRAQPNCRATGKQGNVCTQVKSPSVFFHKEVAKEEEATKEKATLRTGKHYHAVFRVQALSYIETGAEWRAAGEIPWKAGQSKTKAKKTLCLIRKGNCKKEQNQQETPQYWVSHSYFCSPTDKQQKPDIIHACPSVTCSSVKLPEDDKVPNLLLPTFWVQRHSILPEQQDRHHDWETGTTLPSPLQPFLTSPFLPCQLK